MRNVSVNIRLLVLVPVVFAGLALLAALGTYEIVTQGSGRSALGKEALILWWAMVTLLGFAIGYLIMRPLLKPVSKLVTEAHDLEVVRSLSAAGEEPPAAAVDEMARFATTVNQVTELLGQLEAQRLFPAIVGRSRSLLSVLSLTRKIAASEASVLIVGESGTGKELVARSLHEHSPRHGRAFMAVNCAAIPANLLEGALFGHEKGAFTGADARRIGTFEAANGGTLFLDEIGDMPLETQAKILRAIEQREIQRLGSNDTLPVDVRIVAATNKDLPAMVAKGEFREDLFFRIHVFHLVMPPLRERREDIPLLVHHFLGASGKLFDVSAEAMAQLTAYPWPGNIRELRNAVEVASVLADGTIRPEHLPAEIQQTVALPPESAANGLPERGLRQRLEEFERALIIEALARSGGVQARAAEILGITQRSLWHRVAKLEIDVAAIRKPAK